MTFTLSYAILETALNFHMKERTKVLIRLDPDMLERIDKRAASEKRTRTNMVEVILEDAMK